MFIGCSAMAFNSFMDWAWRGVDGVFALSWSAPALYEKTCRQAQGKRGNIVFPSRRAGPIACGLAASPCAGSED